MKAQNQCKSAARIKPYRGRSHTKKQKNDTELKQSVNAKNVATKNRKAIKTAVANTSYTHYRHCEKPNQPCENNPSQKLNVKYCTVPTSSSNLEGAKVSTQCRRDFKEALSIPGDAIVAMEGSISPLNVKPCPAF